MNAAPPFDWITPRLALGGCWDSLTPADLAALGVGAVVDLRSEACDDAASLARHGIRFLHLPTPDLQPVPEAMLDAGVDFADAAAAEDRPLLIHCQHGIGRSALLGLCILVDWGWTPAAALARIKQGRERVSPSPAQYEAWAAWLGRRLAAADEAWTIPDFQAFAAVAYRHLAAT